MNYKYLDEINNDIKDDNGKEESSKKNNCHYNDDDDNGREESSSKKIKISNVICEDKIIEINDFGIVDDVLDPTFPNEPKSEWIFIPEDDKDSCDICRDYIGIFSATCSEKTTHLNCFCYICAQIQSKKLKSKAICPWCGDKSLIKFLSIARSNK
jgi:hypothetical protein